MSGILAKHLYKSFGTQDVLIDLSFEFPDRGFIGIEGVSGSGKSTLLNILGGLDTDFKGELKVFGADYRTMKEEALSSHRLREVGFFRQNHALLDLESARDNCLLPYVAAQKEKGAIRRKKGKDLLALGGLEKKERTAVNRLSGGEKARVALGRSLANDPPLLLCDEPSSALDEASAAKVFEVLKSYAAKALVVVVSHDKGLLRKYADWIYELKDGRLGKPVKGEGKSGETPRPIRKKYFKEKPHVPYGFWLGHAARTLKEKSKRTAVAISALTIAMVTMLFSTYLSDGLSGEVSKAFTSIVGYPSVVIEKSNPDEPTFTRIISAPLDDVTTLVSEYPDVFADYGITYVADFENFFPDYHEAFIPHKSSKIVVPGLSLRTANDYLYPDSIYGAVPELPSFLEDDQIILGLPYASMANVCYGLQILRSYETLGEYIEENGLQLIFRMGNYSWAYEDEQVLDIVAVTRSDVPTIYHYSNEWSTYLFEFKMRLPSTDEPDGSLPWLIQKIPYVVPANETDFLTEIRRGRFSGYVFDVVSSDYEKTHCEVGKRCDLNRYYVYLADERKMEEEQIEAAMEVDGVSSVLTCTDGSYVTFPSAYMTGFLYPFYVARTDEEIDEVIDAVSYVKEAEKDYEAELPDGVIKGSYMLPASASLTLYPATVSEYVSGVPPASLDEIGISTSLAEKLGYPSYINIGATIGEEIVSGYCIRDIRKANLKVSGIFDSQFDSLGHDGRYAEDFFSYVIGMSTFYLRPTKLICYLEEGKEEAAFASLLSLFPNYTLSRPYIAMEESISSLTSIFSNFLGLLSYVAYFFAILLLLSTCFLFAQEGKREKRLLEELGIGKEDIMASSFFVNLLVLLSAFAISAFMSVFIEFFVSYIIADSFQTGLSFTYDPSILLSVVPFMVIGLAATILYEVFSILLRRRKKPVK